MIIFTEQYETMRFVAEHEKYQTGGKWKRSQRPLLNDEGQNLPWKLCFNA